MHRAGVRTMRLETRQEYVGSSPRVSRACQDGAREFARRRPRLAEKLSGVAEKLVGSWDGLVMDVLAIMIDFTEGIGKIARNTLGDRQRKIVRLAAGEAEGPVGKLPVP
ncbi:hypothetical protein B296_00009029 [Ensete ventricosum]|uniref:Uncharacterized protein n=1 Tax=Ensete ventricosum TaxID=4639 RepID=A0A426ZKP4_ENSVE|nr:hypothetical protein B296_00009029 [Ensete ventricosum]